MDFSKQNDKEPDLDSILHSLRQRAVLTRTKYCSKIKKHHSRIASIEVEQLKNLQVEPLCDDVKDTFLKYRKYNHTSFPNTASQVDEKERELNERVSRFVKEKENVIEVIVEAKLETKCQTCLSVLMSDQISCNKHFNKYYIE